MQPKIGGRYTVQQCLGRGGCGAVYLCVDETLHREVAVKMLHSSVADESVLRRFTKEAQALSSLKHPNITKFYSFAVDDQSIPFFVMDRVTGITLSEELARSGALTVERAKKLFDGLLDALSHAHSLGIIHRDIKPSNIVVNQTDGQERLVLIDFGLTKFAGADGQNATKTGTILGTPLYMSPEQCNGSPIDFRSDIYSVGCVLFETVTGRPPFDGTAMEILLGHTTLEPQGMPAELSSFISKCMAKDPAKRFQTADAARNALQDGVEFESSSSAALPKVSKKPSLAAVTSMIGVIFLIVAVALLLANNNSSNNNKSVSSEDLERIARGNEKPNAVPERQQAQNEDFKTTSHSMLVAADDGDFAKAEKLKVTFLNQCKDMQIQSRDLTRLADKQFKNGKADLGIQNSDRVLAQDKQSKDALKCYSYRQHYFSTPHGLSAAPLDSVLTENNEAIHLAKSLKDLDARDRLLMNRAHILMAAGKSVQAEEALENARSIIPASSPQRFKFLQQYSQWQSQQGNPSKSTDLLMEAFSALEHRRRSGQPAPVREIEPLLTSAAQNKMLITNKADCMALGDKLYNWFRNPTTGESQSISAKFAQTAATLLMPFDKKKAIDLLRQTIEYCATAGSASSNPDRKMNNIEAQCRYALMNSVIHYPEFARSEDLSDQLVAARNQATTAPSLAVELYRRSTVFALKQNKHTQAAKIATDGIALADHNRLKSHNDDIYFVEKEIYLYLLRAEAETKCGNIVVANNCCAEAEKLSRNITSIASRSNIEKLIKQQRSAGLPATPNLVAN